MYCPNCATQNIDQAQFCRACGADISFLSTAMNRRAPEREKPDFFAPPFAGSFFPGRRTSEKENQVGEKGLRYTFIGAGFLLIGIIMLFAAPATVNWALCFSMLCAAFPLLGSGIAKVLHARRQQQTMDSGVRETRQLSAQSIAQLPAPNTSEIIRPPSVTEGTTKTLKAPTDRDT